MIGTLVNHLLMEEEEDIFINERETLNSWTLVSTPVPALLTLGVYLYFVLSAGPRFMATRKPYDLRSTMMCYNILQVVYNSWMFYRMVIKTDVISYLMEHSCIPIRIEKLANENFEEVPITITLQGLTLDILKKYLIMDNRIHMFQMCLFAWCYFVSKILDLFDTVLIVLRKKKSHITFLHLYHHVSMVFFLWISMKYTAAQQAFMPAILNVFVHIVMYGYYFLASLGPLIRPFLWWKRYLTKLQLGQFALVILYLGYLNYNGCRVSKAFNYIWIFNVTVIATFFINFYVQTYLRPKPDVSFDRSANHVVKNKIH